MGSQDLSTIEILNWEKFNPRKDLKATTWFRLQNTLFEDPAFFEFTHTELMVWIYLLSLASKKQAGTIHFSMAHAERIGRFKSKDVLSAIDKLIELHCVRITSALCDGDVTSTSRARTTTNERNERDETNETDERHIDFDFESLYSKYPRKLGKQRGIEKCESQIKTLEDFQDLSRAIDRYKSFVAAQGTEEQYIKHFSSFMSSWRDWLDPETGTSTIGSDEPFDIAKARAAMGRT